MRPEMNWGRREERQLVLVDVNICFLGSEALQKLQRFHFKFRSLFLLPVKIHGAEKISETVTLCLL